MPGYFSDADELYDLINGWDGMLATRRSGYKRATGRWRPV